MSTKFSDKLDFVKSIPLEEYLTSRGSVYSKSLNRNTVEYFCPHHGDTTKPNLIVTRSKNVCHCFACGFSGDVLGCESYLKYNKSSKEIGKDLFRQLVDSLYEEYCGRDLTPFVGDSYKHAEEEYTYKRKFYDGIVNDYKSARLSGLDSSSIAYINRRGIDLTTANIYGIAKGEIGNIPQVVLPLIVDKEIVALKFRRNDLISTEGKRYYIPTTSDTKYPYILNPEKSNRLFFTEDSFSALAIRSLGFPAASLFTGNKIPQEGIDIYKKEFETKELIIIPDNDDAGVNVLIELGNLCNNFIFSFCENAKDFSEFSEKNRKGAYDFLVRLWRNYDELLYK